VTVKTFHGSCHCGDVRYSAAFDLSKGTAKCNCTLCRKTRAWHVVLKPEDFALLSDPGLTHEYAWVAPGQSAPRMGTFSCKRCAIGLYARGDFGRGLFYAISIPTLVDIDIDELFAAPIRFEDGLHDRFDRCRESA
jgi:hypothetical protein